MRQPELDQIHSALKCLKILAGLDGDYASQNNDIGFNKADTSRGHFLARKETLTLWEFIEAKRYVWTYRRQLPADLIEIVYRGYTKPTSEPMIGDLGGDEAPTMTVPPEMVTTTPLDFEIEGEGFDDLEPFPETIAKSAATSELAALDTAEAELPTPSVDGLDTYTGVKPTDEQQAAVQRIISWLTDPSAPLMFRMGGYAGTGKTTTIKYLLHLLQLARNGDGSDELSFLMGKTAMVCAFTGKAASVLRKKGVQASTIHSLMYRPVPKAGGGPNDIEWRRVAYFDLPGNFFIVDEASMISSDIYKDMLEYGLKMLFIGDPGQLEPVGDNPNLMRNPDVTLMKIHRQALESPIIELATNIRNGYPLPKSSAHPDLIIRDKNLNTHDLLGVTQVICAKNATRQRINTVCRQAYSRVELLEKGDKLIITKNNKDLGVFNGMIVYVREISSDNHRRWNCLLEDEDQNMIGWLPIAKEPFSAVFDAKNYRHPKDLVQADYGYCVTCHKAQGSEWEHVLVIYEWMPPNVWCMKRWGYTAFTRASKRLTIARDIK